MVHLLSGLIIWRFALWQPDLFGVDVVSAGHDPVLVAAHDADPPVIRLLAHINSQEKP